MRALVQEREALFSSGAVGAAAAAAAPRPACVVYFGCRYVRCGGVLCGVPAGFLCHLLAVAGTATAIFILARSSPQPRIVAALCCTWHSHATLRLARAVALCDA